MISNTDITINKQKFESIDMMRGIAILMVMLVHTSQKIHGPIIMKLFTRYGQMGVQMFFVASAFTLCYSLDARNSKSDSIFNFYIKRLFRIAPGYYVGILIYFVINLVLEMNNINNTWKGSYNPLNILINVLFLNGFYPQANNNVVPGGWSIGTEMIFYLIFPLIFKLYKILLNKFKYIYLILPLIMLAMSVGLQYGIYSIKNNPDLFSNNGFIYFNIVNQLPAFLVGMSMYFAYKEGFLEKINSKISLTMFLLLSVISGYLFIKGSTIFTFAFSIIPFLSALSFVFIFILLQYNSKIRSKLIAKVGVRSYSCYLLHIIFAYYVTEFLSRKNNFLNGDIGLILLYLMTVTLTYFLSGLMYKYVELTGLKLGKNFINFLNHKQKPEKLHNIQDEVHVISPSIGGDNKFIR